VPRLPRSISQGSLAFLLACLAASAAPGLAMAQGGGDPDVVVLKDATNAGQVAR
jgi:hypothetical protein